jgi:cytochrome c oxidase cbb3-type subunit IV
MDVNDLRSLVTVLSLVTFVGIWAWAWSRRNQSAFDQAANLPFIDTPINEMPLDNTAGNHEAQALSASRTAEGARP